MNKEIGKQVENVHIRNPKAVAIINERAQRDHIHAATAAALIILESRNQQGHANQNGRNPQANSRRDFRDEAIEKGAV